MVLEQSGEQDGLVADAVAETHQRLGQFFKRQVREGRDKVQVKGDVLHRQTLTT